MTIRRFAKWAVFVVPLTIMIHAAAFRGSGETRRIDPGNLRILGITLGKSTTEDVERAFGPAVDTAPPESELSQVCYFSSGLDKTVLEFVIWDKPVEFRFFRASPSRSPRCTRTTLVSDKLETDGGLRLGMDRSQVTSMFGRPTEIRGDRSVYDFSYDRPLTSEEIKRYKDATPPVSAVGVTDKIEFRFSGSRVVLIDVTYSETF